LQDQQLKIVGNNSLGIWWHSWKNNNIPRMTAILEEKTEFLEEQQQLQAYQQLKIGW